VAIQDTVHTSKLEIHVCAPLFTLHMDVHRASKERGRCRRRCRSHGPPRGHGCMGHTCTVTTDEMYSIVGHTCTVTTDEMYSIVGHTCTVTTDEMYSIVGDFKIVRVRISVSLLYLQVHHQPAQEDDAWATSRTAQKQPSGRERRK
jgi:hypothetical protein